MDAHLPAATLNAIREGAIEDQDSVLQLAQALIRVPSQGGIDPYEPIIEVLERWLEDHRVPSRRLLDSSGDPVGLMIEIEGAQRDRRYVLDACIDTAPFGNLDAWTHPPTSGAIVDGWLHGRGSADCKFAAAIFAHLAARLLDQRDQLGCGITVLFDADEHTGRFGGVRAFLEEVPPTEVAGVMVGYPGLDKVVVGGRGFLRAKMLVHGIAGHSGASDPATSNAISKAADLVQRLNAAPLPSHESKNASSAGQQPKLTVTAIHAGDRTGSYTIVPDLCAVHVDLRLTTDFDQEDAVGLLKQTAFAVDEQWPSMKPISVLVEDTWPAYRLPHGSPISASLMTAAERWTGTRPRFKVAGPSNIGNYLASYDVPTTAGFGVRYLHLHGTDESIDTHSGWQIHAAYHEAVLRLSVDAVGC